MNLFHHRPILLAALALPSFALALPPDVPDPHGIVIKPVPEKLVVLTFDDSVASHATVAAPLLKKLGFGGSFFICDFDSFKTRKDWYMTWDQIKSLDDDGFDVGNHTKGHGGASINDWVAMEVDFASNGVSKPTTLCWPLCNVHPRLYPELIKKGYTFGRGGHERAYRPAFDHPFDVPSFGIHDRVSYESFVNSARQATRGRIVVFTFHGVPEGEHPSVSLDPAEFARMMEYLKDNQYQVIGLRDLATYVDVKKAAKFLPYPSHLPWGGVTLDGDLLHVSVRKLPSDRKLTLPGMTTRISRAFFAEDPEKQALAVTRADNGIQTLVVPDSPFALAGEYPTAIVAELQGGPVATILEFGIPGAPPGAISGDEIRVKVPLAANPAQLAATYDTGSPRVAGQPASGAVTDFTRPQTYAITGPDGSARSYRVTITPTPGAVAVGNPDFERFDVLAEQGTKPIPCPMGVAWSFNKKGNQGEIGIKDLIASPSAPPPPNGSRHVVYIRGAGNSISQRIVFDPGTYVIRFDAVKRNGYEKTAAPLKVMIDGVPVFALQSSEISEKWASYRSPAFPVSSGPRELAFALGEGDGMDIIDNVVLEYVGPNP